MSAFVGYVELEARMIAPVLVRDNQLQPQAADALPTFRVYGPGGFLGVSGTGWSIVEVPGLYYYEFDVLSTSGFVAGTTYWVLLSWTNGGVPASALEVFIVN